MSTTFDPSKARFAFIHASWHTDIVLKCLDGFREGLAERGYNTDNIDVVAVLGAYEIPLQAKLLAKTGRFAIDSSGGDVCDGFGYVEFDGFWFCRATKADSVCCRVARWFSARY